MILSQKLSMTSFILDLSKKMLKFDEAAREIRLKFKLQNLQNSDCNQSKIAEMSFIPATDYLSINFTKDYLQKKKQL